MSLRLKEKVKKLRRSLSWHNTSIPLHLELSLDNVIDSLVSKINEAAGFIHSHVESVVCIDVLLHSGFETAESPDGIATIYHGDGKEAYGLPDGWESAIDKDGRVYYINHRENISTYNDPRDQLDVECEYPETRIVTLERDSQLGYGFVAGSERPVVVRCVTEGGPSDGILWHGDQIHKINAEDVRDAPRSRVIDLVRSSEGSLTLTVSQPPTISTQGKKSILLNAAKKQQRPKRDSSASRVRFNEDSFRSKKRCQIIEGTTPSNLDNVLRVHLETNQTRSFKYDKLTQVKNVLSGLQEKLSIKCIEHFGLVLHNTKSPLSAKMTALSPSDKVHQFVPTLADGTVKCLLRIVYVPKDAYDMLRKDMVAFQYFYTQCCNDVIHERFSSDLKCDTALRLASLHMQEHAIEHKFPFNKINTKLIEKEFGLGMFLNPSMLRVVRPKELRKMLTHFMKLNQGLIAPGQRQVTPLQAKLHYMKIISELRSFGGKCFLATLVDHHTEVMLLVGPKCGISQVTDIKAYTLHMLADFDLIEDVYVEDERDGSTRLIKLTLTDKNLPIISLSMMADDAKDFLTFIQGYYQLFCGEHDIMRNSPLPLQPKSKFKDINQNEGVENDYATIEEVFSDLNGHSVDEDTESVARIKHCDPDTAVIQHKTGNSVFLQSQPETDNVQEERRPQTQVKKVKTSLEHVIIANVSNRQDEPDYDITPDETPFSSIDDIISTDSPDEDRKSYDDGDVESISGAIDGLTEECINELSKLDNAGALLDPRMFTDKEVYLDPEAAEVLDLSSLPPPEETELIAPLSPPPTNFVPPPPELFDDVVQTSPEASTRNADEAIGVQMSAVDAFQLSDKETESGIDSDDSGTETFNSEAGGSTLANNGSISLTTPDSAIGLSPAPVTSLRSRLQQRARERLAETLPESQLDLPRPVKLDGFVATRSPISTAHKRSKQQPNIDARMAEALMQLNDQLATDSESEDEKHMEEKITSASHTESVVTCSTESTPMMFGDSHVDISTEEEDNDGDEEEEVTHSKEIATELLTDMPLSSSSICSQTVEHNTTSHSSADNQHSFAHSEDLYKSSNESAAAAIDDALAGLSSGSTSDNELEQEKLVAHSVSSSSDVTTEVKTLSDISQWTSKQSAVLDHSATNLDNTGVSVSAKTPSATIIVPGDNDVCSISLPNTPRPQPPPRRKKSLNSSAPAASLSSLRIYDSVPPPRCSPAQEAIIECKREARSPQSPRSPRPLSLIPLSVDTSFDSVSLNSSLDETPAVQRRSYNNRKTKEERATRTASVIGGPTNVHSTAADILASCVPIAQLNQNDLDSKPSSVIITSRTSLLEEITKHAPGLGINPSAFDKDVSNRQSGRSSTSTASEMSTGSSITTSKYQRLDSNSSEKNSPRPNQPPPPPPMAAMLSGNVPVRASRSESDLLAISTQDEAMLAVEYTVIADQSIGENFTSATSKEKRSRDNSLRRDSGLEKDGSFIKFSGYNGMPDSSPTIQRTGRFRKKSTRPVSLADSRSIGEPHGKKGIMAKILSTIKPRKRSMSLDRLNMDITGRKLQGGSLKTTKSNRSSILGGGGKPKLYNSVGKSASDNHISLDALQSCNLTFFSTHSSVESLLDHIDKSKDEEATELLNSGDKINPAAILTYTYEMHNAFEEAIKQTVNMMDYFVTLCDTQWAPSLTHDPNTFTQIKENLITEGKQLVANSKQLVAGVTQATGPSDAVLVNKMAASVRTLAKIIQMGAKALQVTRQEDSMMSLRECIMTVSEAYKDVLQTSYHAAGKPMYDENMMAIMQKASHLASLLSLFTKTLRALQDV